MNFSKSLMFVALTGILFTSCKDSAAENTSETDEAIVASNGVAVQPETASFNIEGMSCAVGCAKTIEKKLNKMEGVQHATVDFDTKTAKVDFDASKISSENIVEAVESAADGKTYKVADVKSSKDQAMNYTDPVKKDKKKKSKKEKKADAEKKDCAPTEGGEKKSCCSKGGSM